MKYRANYQSGITKPKKRKRIIQDQIKLCNVLAKPTFRPAKLSYREKPQTHKRAIKNIFKREPDTAKAVALCAVYRAQFDRVELAA